MIEASDAEVQAALDRLKSLSLVVESSGGRVMRYAQNVGKVLGLPPQSVAILTVLFLRGPQTPGELRINSERLHRFGDLLSVQAFLEELAERPFVRELAKAPGAREARWVHLLSGEPAATETAAPTAQPAGGALAMGEVAAMRSQLDQLQREVAELRETVARLAAQLGADA